MAKKIRLGSANVDFDTLTIDHEGGVSSVETKVMDVLHLMFENAGSVLTRDELITLTLASPMFLIAGLLAVADGFVERDLRKWGGGRESGYLFHIAKRFIAPTLTLFAVLLLSSPISINPVMLTIPAAAAVALAIRFTSSSFKKYL